MERGDCCQSPAPRSRAGRPRVQRLREQPERSGRGPGSGLHGEHRTQSRGRSGAAAPFPDGPPAFLVRLRRFVPPGAGSRREPGTCARSLEVSPGSPGRFPCAGWGCELQTSATRVGGGVGAPRLQQVGTRWERPRAGGEGGPCAPSPSELPLSRRPPAPGPGGAGPSWGRGQGVWVAALMRTRGPGLEKGTDE